MKSINDFVNNCPETYLQDLCNKQSKKGFHQIAALGNEPQISEFYSDLIFDMESRALEKLELSPLESLLLLHYFVVLQFSTMFYHPDGLKREEPNAEENFLKDHVENILSLGIEQLMKGEYKLVPKKEDL